MPTSKTSAARRSALDDLGWPHDDEPIASGDTVSVFWSTASAVVVNYFHA